MMRLGIILQGIDFIHPSTKNSDQLTPSAKTLILIHSLPSTPPPESRCNQNPKNLRFQLTEPHPPRSKIHKTHPRIAPIQIEPVDIELLLVQDSIHGDTCMEVSRASVGVPIVRSQSLWWCRYTAAGYVFVGNSRLHAKEGVRALWRGGWRQFITSTWEDSAWHVTRVGNTCVHHPGCCRSRHKIGVLIIVATPWIAAPGQKRRGGWTQTVGLSAVPGLNRWTN